MYGLILLQLDIFLKVQSNFEDIPLDFDGDGYKELLILRSAFSNEVTSLLKNGMAMIG